MRDRSSTHVPALDGVRAIAIAAVIVFHVLVFTTNRPHAVTLGEQIYRRLVEPMHAGVTLFFVLSGLLITRILIDARRSPSPFVAFYGRRVLRIFPLYYAVLLGHFVLVPWITGAPAADASAQGWFWTYTVNDWMALHGWPPSPLNHFWSLAVEEQFYLAWPLLVIKLDDRWVRRACVLAIATSIGYRLACALHGAPELAHLATPAQLDALAAGSLLAVAAPAGADRARLRPLGVPLAIASCAAFALVQWTPVASAIGPIAPMVLGPTLLTALSFAIVVAAYSAPPGSRLESILSARPLRVVAKYSYAMYVFHGLLLSGAWRYCYAIRPFVLRKTGSWVLVQLVTAPYVAALTFVLAVVSWYVLEQPFLRWKRLFEYGASPRAAAIADRGAVEET